MACVPFKINYWLQANEYYYCTCKRRTFNITYLERNVKYSVASKANNCFHCWFIMMIEIKVNKIYKKRNNLVHFASSLADFFLLFQLNLNIYTVLQTLILFLISMGPMLLLVIIWTIGHPVYVYMEKVVPVKSFYCN